MDLGTRGAAGIDLIPDAQVAGKIHGPGGSNCGDATGEIQTRKRGLRWIGAFAELVEEVFVHAHEPGEERPSATVDDGCICGWLDIR